MHAAVVTIVWFAYCVFHMVCAVACKLIVFRGKCCNSQLKLAQKRTRLSWLIPDLSWKGYSYTDQYCAFRGHGIFYAFPFHFINVIFSLYSHLVYDIILWGLMGYDVFYFSFCEHYSCSMLFSLVKVAYLVFVFMLSATSCRAMKIEHL